MYNVTFEGIKIFDISSGFGYGYDGLTSTGGRLEYILKYTPAPFTGDYKATITIETEPAVVIPPAVTTFTILESTTATALATLYPVSSGQALPGDLVVLQLDVSADIRHMAVDKVTGVPKITVTGDLLTETLSMTEASKFHPALREKWGVLSTADYLLPVRVPGNAVPGQFNPRVTAEAIDGVPFTTSTTSTPPTSPRVDVVSTRSSFNVYLMPRFNFISPPLQCATGDCTAAFEFKIKELLEKQVVPRSKLNPAFPDSSGNTTGDVPLSDIIDTIHAYDVTLATSDFTSYLSDAFVGNDTLTIMGVGRGYIFRTKIVSGEVPFKKIKDAGNPQFPLTEIPVPIKLTFTGAVVATGNAPSPSITLKKRWNLVGPHTEKDTTVGVYMGPIAPTTVDRKWRQLIGFKNLLDVSLVDGKVKLREGKPEILFEKRFESLRAPAGFPDAGPNPLPSGSSVPAGVALWLLMSEDSDLSGPLE